MNKKSPIESLKTALKEMILIRQNKMKKHIWKEFKEKLCNIDCNDCNKENCESKEMKY